MGIKRLLWDVEITPNVVLAFRAGYDLTINHDAIIQERRLICIGYKWQHEKKPHVLRCAEDGDDRQLINDFIEIAKEADELVAHFGDRADLPWLRARALIHHLDPIPFFKTIDTKAWASKNYGFNSNKLDHLSDVLGHGKKLHTDFQLWKDIVVGSPAVKKRAMDYMCKYCGVDVLRLEKVYLDLAPNVKPKTHVGVLEGGEKWTCPRCGSRSVTASKKRVSANGTITWQMKCLDDGAYFTISDSTYKKWQKERKAPQSTVSRQTPQLSR